MTLPVLVEGKNSMAERGDARPGSRKVPLPVRLARHIAIDPQTGCHNWTGSLTHNGYGQMGGRNGSARRAHRVAYELAFGPIPPGLHIDHLCRNRRCVNPAHLQVVTPAENTRRGLSPSAVAARLGVCRNGHPLEGANVKIVGSKKSRTCRRCGADYRRQYMRSRRAARRLLATTTSEPKAEASQS